MRTSRELTTEIRRSVDGLEPSRRKSSTLSKDELQTICDENGIDYDTGEGYNDGDTSADLRAAICRDVIGRSGTTSVDVPLPFIKIDKERLLRELSE